MKIGINFNAWKSGCGSNSCAPAKPKPPCSKPPSCNKPEDPCKPKSGAAIGFGVMPLGMIAFGGLGIGKFF
ncbi:hypothetical protein [Pseudomonas marginalis]|uniref:hypothetical protein n=1 Tax=Pseudomonas marginalis TaxID=298 RepID=UPI000A54C89F|nr:hypothetical protein [Pseudomonas marginalis]